MSSNPAVGDFEQAQLILQGMEAKGVVPDVVTWMTLLGPCRLHRNLAVAEYAFEKILKTGHPDRAAAFTVLGDVYRAIGREDLATELHGQRLRLGLQKHRGAVDVTVDGKTFTFHVGDTGRAAALHRGDHSQT